MTKILCIGGLDSSGGAGLSADIKTISSIGFECQTILTANTAQTHNKLVNYWPTSSEAFLELWKTCLEQGEPEVIKIGLIPNKECLEILSQCLQGVKSFVIFDPVLSTSSGFDFGLKNEELWSFFQKVHLLTPNIPEAIKIFGSNYLSILEHENFSFSTLLKSGHSDDKTYCQDILFHEGKCFPYITQRVPNHFRGTGCTLSSAIAAFYCHDQDLVESIAKAKSYISQCMQSHPPYLSYKKWPDETALLAKTQIFPFQFPDCGPELLGTYPVVHHSAWLEKLLSLGIKTIQIRIKDLSGTALDHEIEKCVELAEKNHCRLFVNDYWELAIKHKAYGVHLGQEDLESADMQAIHEAGLRLGISTHSYYEAMIAHSFNPSYVALGPIYETTLKKMKFGPQGLEKLRIWCKLFKCPIVAIGGLNPERGALCYQNGAASVAMVSDVTLSENYEQRIAEWKSIEPIR